MLAVSLDTAFGATPESEALGRAELDREISELMSVAEIPGLSIAVIEHGQLSWTEAYGVVNTETGEAVGEPTVFEAASLTKPVFAYLVLKLAERGALSLDQPLHELLSYERFGGVKRSLALTPRIVLSHRTGLPNWGGPKLPFRFDPGSRFGYSGEGYLYLQRAIEKLTGEPIEALMQREVFDPLGMKDSRLTWKEGEEFGLATGHSRTGEARVRNPPEVNVAGSLFTTVRDYARFATAVLGGEGLERASFETALSPAIHMQGDERGYRKPEEIAGKVGWGLGWGTQESADGRIVWHWGDNDIFQAFVALRPSDGSGVVYFANSAAGLTIARRLMELTIGDMRATFAWLDRDYVDDPGWSERHRGFLAERERDYPAAVRQFELALEAAPDDEVTRERVRWLEELTRIGETPVSIERERLESYAGSYGPRKIRVEEGHLVYQRQGRDARRLLPVSQDTFALEGMVDFRIQVVLDEAGRPVALRGLYLGGDPDENPRDPGS